MPTDREFHEGWGFLYFISRHAEGGMFVGVAEIQKRGELHSKLVSARAETSNQFAIDRLREPCRAWAADWAARPHTGDTGACL